MWRGSGTRECITLSMQTGASTCNRNKNAWVCIHDHRIMYLTHVPCVDVVIKHNYTLTDHFSYGKSISIHVIDLVQRIYPCNHCPLRHFFSAPEITQQLQSGRWRRPRLCHEIDHPPPPPCQIIPHSLPAQNSASDRVLRITTVHAKIVATVRQRFTMDLPLKPSFVYRNL